MNSRHVRFAVIDPQTPSFSTPLRRPEMAGRSPESTKAVSPVISLTRERASEGALVLEFLSGPDSPRERISTPGRPGGKVSAEVGRWRKQR